MTMLIAPISAERRKLWRADAGRVDRTERAARREQDAFYALHGGFGARALYRLVSALS